MAMVPTIHMNGTSAKALVEQQQAVLRHLSAARDAMCHAAPHGRDYYPQGNGAIDQAMTEHYDRMRRLDAIRDELVEIALHAQHQSDARRAA